MKSKGRASGTPAPKVPFGQIVPERQVVPAAPLR
jgi:hypothetical protein